MTIFTPKGKKMSPGQYLALHQARFTREGTAPACKYGHFDCAAWEDGPCSDELRTQQEQK